MSKIKFNALCSSKKLTLVIGTTCNEKNARFFVYLRLVGLR
jgi:hypothetical protein